MVLLPPENSFFKKSVTMKYLRSKSVNNKKVAYGRDTLPQKNSGQKLQK